MSYYRRKNHHAVLKDSSKKSWFGSNNNNNRNNNNNNKNNGSSGGNNNYSEEEVKQNNIERKRRQQHWNRMKKIKHNKIRDYVNSNFYYDIGFDELLFMDLQSGCITMDLYWNRFISKNKYDWMEEPDICDDIMELLIPIYKRLRVWKCGQRLFGLNGKYVKATFAFTGNEFDIKESGIDSPEKLYIALNAFVEMVERTKVFELDIFEERLCRNFKINKYKRRYNWDNDNYKYIMENGFIPSRYMKNREIKDDTTVIRVKESLRTLYPNSRIMVQRMGRSDKEIISKKLLITSNDELDLNKLNKKCRRIMGCRVSWTRYQANPPNKDKKKKLSYREKEEELDKIQIIHGKHGDMVYYKNDKQDK